ncbi:MAG: ADP-forming succinate--CoA ligase subunit beta [Alphaproteobacteria bacterium]|nr:ADP-forming succinate--CoA ligase subunit beta [Alphaproteobacteria bacterium]
MKLHEYQAKEILRRHGVPVPPGKEAHTVADAIAAAKELGGDFFVVKAMVHAGGRGKGRFKEVVSHDVLEQVLAGAPDVPGKGGVQLCGGATHDEAVAKVQAAAECMLGNTLVTKQTGIEGVPVKTIFVTTGADIETELYAAILLDRQTSRLLLMASTEGGTEIEEVAEEHPDAIHKVWADPVTGLGAWQCREMASKLGLQGKAFKGAVKMFRGLYDAYLAADASMVEINPLVITPDQDVVALDAKVTIDDNAVFRQKEIASWYDSSEDDPAEVEAAAYHLSFIKLDGNIGCMVNGAGLAMATMDIIKFYGGEPANFLDVGGGAKKDQVKAALTIITKDPAVKCILVNIFGGIMRCDVIAEGVVAAVAEAGLEVPLVVRLAGTNAEQGKQILASSGLAIIPADTLADAAEKAVAAVGSK